MDFEELREKYSPVLRQYMAPLGLGALGLAFLGYGLTSSAVPQDKPDILFEAASTKAEAGNTKKIAVDVEGAVLNPGVYELDTDARVQDALIAAGGMSDDADRGKISKSLNLAAKITDGAKIYIPVKGEVGLASSGQGSGGDAVLGDISGLINLNEASENELDTLQGVGAVTAQKIIDGRPYQSVDELLSKKIVGSKVFGQIKEKITVY